jgi:predicted glycoside hydrolase/deacetylase ChbG (UPF0249 family)
MVAQLMPRLLIVNADDFGIHADVNRGIVNAYRHGAVRSASVMVNMPAFADAVRLAGETPGLEVGLHFNVTSGPCVAPPRLLPLLVNSNGLFRFSEHNIPTAMSGFWELADGSQAFAEQIRIEGEYQLERLLSNGLFPGHLTIHHYLSLLHPRIFEVYLELAESARLPCRAISRPISEIFGVSVEAERVMLARLATSTVRSPVESISNLLDGSTERCSSDVYRDLIIARLRWLCRRSEPVSFELVTHPTDLTPVVRELDTVYLWARELETALVFDPVFLSAVAELGLTLGGYQQLPICC